MGVKNPSRQGGPLGKLWNLPNTALGLMAGVAGLPFGANITFGDNAVQFQNYPFGSPGALTLRNVQLYHQAVPADMVTSYDGQFTVNLGRHEGGHSYQSEKLGAGFLPAYFMGGGISESNKFEKAADNYSRGAGSWWPGK